ncbi:hypothetical protein EON65_11005 [archaeon]|nr:MAG: hypothetical protein EON65_11005 [archaeon]
MASLSAKSFQIHDENDYTLSSSTKSQLGKRALGGKPVASMGPSKGLSLKGSSEGLQQAKSQRKALSSLTTSNLNARNSLSSTLDGKAHKSGEVKKVPIITITRNEMEDGDNDMVTVDLVIIRMIFIIIVCFS